MSLTADRGFFSFSFIDINGFFCFAWCLPCVFCRYLDRWTRRFLVLGYMCVSSGRYLGKEGADMDYTPSSSSFDY